MRKYFFYTDPSTLEDQTAGEAFGPAQPGIPGATDDSKYDKYRVTNLHTTSSGKTAPAIAVCDGMICVQEDNNGTYSIILKPNYQPPFDFPFIKYFIYKGVDKGSLVSGDGINLSNSGSIPFIDKIQDSWVDPLPDNTSNPISESKKVIGLAYMANKQFDVGGTLKIIFNDSDPIDHLFYYPNENYQLPSVKAGDKIGEFATGFGFEIVLERLGSEPKIKLARTFENHIEAEALSGSSYAPDNAEYFKHWHEKEACLNAIDSCAFYGSFAGGKVFYHDPTARNKSKKCNTPQEIYDHLLIGFHNKNVVYLDVRNDFNFSLNYYKSYGFNYRFSNKDGSQIIDQQSDWPITVFDDLAGAGAVKRNFFRTQLLLPASNGENDVPTVYLSKAYAKNFRRLKRKQKVQTLDKPLGTNPFYSPIDLAFVIIDKGTSTPKLLSGYYRINVYNRSRNSSTATALAPSLGHYLNGLFRPLDMVQPLLLKEQEFTYTVWHEEVLVNLIAHDGPAYVAHVGIAEDTHHISLFALPVYFLNGSFSHQLPDAFTSWANTSKPEKKMFLEKVFELFTGKTLAKQEIEIAGTLDKVDTVVVENNPFRFFEQAFRKSENPEDYIIQIWDKNDYQSIKAQLENGNTLDGSPVFLTIDQVTTDTDIKGIRYKKIAIDGKGVNTNSSVTGKQTIDLNYEIFEYADF